MLKKEREYSFNREEMKNLIKVTNAKVGEKMKHNKL